MELREDELRDRLLGQQAPGPERLTRYRREVEAMLEQMEDRLRRRQWWAGTVQAVLVTLGTVFLVLGALVSGMVTLYMASRQGAGFGDFLAPTVVTLLCLCGAVMLPRRFFQRVRLEEILLEVKRVQVQLLDLQEQLRRQHIPDHPRPSGEQGRG